MSISTEQIKALREATGAGVLECKKALEEAQGDMEKATEILRERGLAKAAKRAGRETHEGLIGIYVHAGNRIAGMVEVNCETDFVARTPDFQTLAHDLAMQVVASSPLYLSPDDVPAEVLEREREIYRAQFADSGKPEHIIDRIVEGKLAQFYKETCLLEQPFIKDDSKTVREIINEAIAKLGENITVRRFVRYAVGEE